MPAGRLNLLTALVSLAGSIAWIALGDVPGGLVWFVASLVWVALAVRAWSRGGLEPEPWRRIGRRIYRLFLWG